MKFDRALLYGLAVAVLCAELLSTATGEGVSHQTCPNLESLFEFFQVALCWCFTLSLSSPIGRDWL
jgi:hypothetical protein